jgi:hypothetical protein
MVITINDNDQGGDCEDYQRPLPGLESQELFISDLESIKEVTAYHISTYSIKNPPTKST